VLVFTLVPLAVFVLASLRSETKLQWTGPPWIAGLPAIALGMIPGTGRAERWLAALWRPAIPAVLALYGAALFIPSLGAPGLSFPMNYYTMSWHDLGRQIEQIELEVIRQTGQEPLIIGLDKYHLSSELAFYDPTLDGAHETAGINLFDRTSLMYARWFPAAAQEGKSLVLVSPDRKDMTREDVLQRVERLEPVRELIVRRGNSVVGHYYARVGHGYRTGHQAP
jgi:dolichol-phosphate mannosyltransferase